MAKETYELRIYFTDKDLEQVVETKEHVKSWLTAAGEESFVEGALDDLDVDLNHNRLDHEHYELLGGETSPLSIYSYDQTHIKNLRTGLEKNFSDKVRCEESSMATEVWQEGWKQSFKPIETVRFYIYPPWDENPIPASKLALKIDPGMAFGTGQHETTRLCLGEIEKLDLKKDPTMALLDVGTGSGILAIAAKKMGIQRVLGTDIDSDAVMAANENTAANGVEVEYFAGTYPPKTEKFEVVVANILGHVLRRIAEDLTSWVKEGGRLILSGLLVEELKDTEACYARYGFKLDGYETQNGWLVMNLVKSET